MSILFLSDLKLVEDKNGIIFIITYGGLSTKKQAIPLYLDLILITSISSIYLIIFWSNREFKQKQMMPFFQAYILSF